jgi:hypothetical protein
MKLPSVDKMCNIAGCILIFVLLALLVFKPSGIMSLLEGQNNGGKNNNNNAVNRNANANNNANNNANRNVNNNANNNANRNVNNNANNNANKGNANKGNANRNANNNAKKGVGASLPLGENEQFAAVSGIQTPTRSCYPQDSLAPKDLLPKKDSDNINNFNKDYPISEGILKGVNFLEAGYQVGVNTVGQSLRNANRQVRSEPPNPQVNVSPWMNTTIGPDLARSPLEVGEDCYASIGNNTL